MAKDTPSVLAGILKLDLEGRYIEVGTKRWFDWLNSNKAKSFRFESDAGSYTARKEQPHSTGYQCWYAYRRINGKLRKRYIGGNEALTLERLEEMHQALESDAKPPQKLPTKTGNNETEEKLKAVLEENQRLQDEIEKLHTQVGNLQAKLDSIPDKLPTEVIGNYDLPDLKKIHERVMSQWRVVKGPEKKERIAKALDMYAAELAKAWSNSSVEI